VDSLLQYSEREEDLEGESVVRRKSSIKSEGMGIDGSGRERSRKRRVEGGILFLFLTDAGFIFSWA